MKRRLDQRVAALLLGIERESLLILILGLYTCGLLARLPIDQLRQDGWLALVSGRFVAHEGLPLRDSLTAWTAGVHWVDQQWLAQLTLYRLYEIGGLRLVMFSHVALLSVALALALSAARWRGGSARSVALIAAPALLTIFLWSQLRTQSFAYPLFVAVVWLLIADARAPSRKVYLAFPLLMLWANFHGSVLLGAALVSLHGALLVLKRRIARGCTLLFLPAACLFASPYGLALIGYYRHTAFNPSFAKLITEWQPSTPSLLTVWFYILAFVGIWLVGRRPNRLTVFELSALALTLAAGMLALRNTLWFSYLALIVLPTPLRDVLTPDATRIRSRVMRAVPVAAIVAVCVFGVVAALRPNTWYAGKAYPDAAASAIAADTRSDPSARIFADMGYADWLLWKEPQLAGNVVYDARLELLRPKTFNELYDWANRIGDSWRTALAGTQLLVLDRHYRRAGADVADSNDWRPLYSDAQVGVFVRAKDG